jgi:allantoin racemase
MLPTYKRLFYKHRDKFGTQRAFLGKCVVLSNTGESLGRWSRSMNHFLVYKEEEEMKIMLVHGQYVQEERDSRRNLVLSAASPETEIEFEEIKGDVFRLSHNADNELLIMLAGPQVVEKAMEAEKRGFDAVVPYGTLDLGVDAARCLVDIPVVGMGRSGFCLAANMATRIGVLVYQSTMIPNTRKFLREIGMNNFVTSIKAVDIPVGEMRAKDDVLKERIFEAGKQLVSEGDAEVIVPRGVSMIPHHCSVAELTKESGVPVIDCVSAGIKLAEVQAGMRLRNSRKAYPRP